METIYSLLMGLVQGLTEFLPVSSSGHLLLMSRLFNMETSIAFDIVLHLGTLLAVVIAFWPQLVKLIKKPFAKPMLVLLTSTAITVLVVILNESFFRSSFGGELLPYAFMATALLLIISDLKKSTAVKEIGFLDGAVIGLVQGIAVIPGLSRSGATISSAKMLGADNEQAAHFSFLLSIPIIVASAAKELISFPGQLFQTSFFNLAVGFLTAFLSGFIAIKFLMKLIKKGGFQYFAIYLAILSVFTFCNDMFLHLF